MANFFRLKSGVIVNVDLVSLIEPLANANEGSSSVFRAVVSPEGRVIRMEADEVEAIWRNAQPAPAPAPAPARNPNR